MITEEEKQEIRAGSYEYGFEEGMQKGIEQERRANISRLLAYGMSPEDISKALDIPPEVIKK